MKWTVPTVALLMSAVGRADDHDHEHGEHAFEWAGVFALSPGSIYAWTASKEETYVDPSMKIVFLEVNRSDYEAQTIAEEVEELAEELMEGNNCTATATGAEIEIPASECFRLVFDEDIYTSIFSLEVHEHHEDGHNDTDAEEEEDHHDHDEDDGEKTFIAIFAEHDPVEFEFHGLHYLKDSHGHDVEPSYLFEDHEEDHDDGGGSSNRREKAWKRSMLASFFVLCCTMIGVVVRLPALWGDDTYEYVLVNPVFTQCAAALAAGALFACAVFLMLFEAVHLTGVRWSEEHATWRFGTMILLGYGLGLFGQYFFEEDGAHLGAWATTAKRIMSSRTKKKALPPKTKAAAQDDDDDADVVVEAAEAAADDEAKSKVVANYEDDSSSTPDGVRWDLVFSISIGDWFHNFVDGLVIARAFLDCKVSKGWTVAAATVYHELAQEVSDFALLVNVAGLGVIPALLINAAAGLSVPLGAAVFMWSDVGDGGQGMLLAFAGGLYIYLATNVGAHNFLDNYETKDFKTKLLVLFSFLLGCVAIGLVLLDHEHCSDKDDDGDGGGGGHAHRL
mmetsp:Transcript_112/g.405  ORF Transcript_112/g.405 Transcript_112/m.405 type:complete len:562 (+) Transcript_112:73-1758(+)